MNKFEVKISGYEIQQKKAKLTSKKSTSCTIYVPKSWEGKDVTIILNEEIEEKMKD